jgi:hypothetical protein
MRYVRQRSWFAWLGLLALAGQVVLTFGHGHAEYKNGLSISQFGLFGLHLEARDHAPPATKSIRHHSDMPTDSDDLGGSCALCWNIAQAASLIFPGPPIVRLGRLQRTVPVQYQAVELCSADQASPFESRGPPLTSKA